jgi:hypothetical protein
LVAVMRLLSTSASRRCIIYRRNCNWSPFCYLSDAYLVFFRSITTRMKNTRSSGRNFI